MKCSYCDVKATHCAYWCRECPRPVIYACPDHFARMAEQARRNGDQMQRLHPGLALEHEAVVIQTIKGKGKLHIAGREIT